MDICGVNFKNPIIAASGTFGFGEEYNKIFDVSTLGGICSKGLTLNKKEGNNGLRIFETPSGILNSVGLQNPGVKHFLKFELPEMKKFNTVVIANLGGATLEDYVEGIKLLDDSDVDMIELNISCPNVKFGGMAFGIKSSIAYEVVSSVKKYCKKPLIVKLSPNAEDIVDMAQKCSNAGADAISLVNTFKAMAVDIYNRKPVFDNITAGLSGPAIKPIALRMVYEVSKAIDIPVIGIGGICTWEDAVEFIMAGASLIQVGTANFINPNACTEILDGIENYMKHEKLKDLSEIRGVV
ncbi:MAG: dihydroorotate dehydrogenase [Clostridium sp.]|jgi:dihydroorotate dehydrogenase (NAD+) catalytic subunit|uniref:dihydroorotate dehydrogenase n=1 Tax=Clostridium sp. TaxID=1506 RepID=UPI0025C28167|nr:dihydroorotate dehydrogenase [Clostridium sp.]MCH3962768.1 dihydroorotate dehydrogenase [Clostridium sp.]MCI1715817.1 dihydroorotate dehydrogenase [Clostridium sp.]MCI1799978.1 dihydroorotate dehydrogenase [Clostridium sp.]MCI1813892.1 dihydroorotate dehydrogenase [Clostridium sp.]MCI1870790.1 dihydroorotate dehydrogenase [Clostridium sp.]